MDIIVHDPGRYHVSLDTVAEFEQAIQDDPYVHLVSSRESPLSGVPNIVWRTLYASMNALGRTAPKHSADGGPAPQMFCVLMGRNFRKTMPRFLGPGQKSIYLFDGWPQHHAKIVSFAKACAVDHLFVSSSQAAGMLGRQLGATACHWVPEGITPAEYYLAPTISKDIDVLQLGRRYDAYHRAVVAPLKERGKSYRYETIPGSVVFPSRLDYVEGLARTKISICVPSSRTHPSRAAGVETMTVRYLQSMLSRCLVVGHAPAEMVELFGYNPLIEIDERDPAAQLLDLIDHLPDHHALIEKNYHAVRENHTWAGRWRIIRKILHGDSTLSHEDKAATISRPL